MTSRRRDFTKYKKRLINLNDNFLEKKKTFRNFYFGEVLYFVTEVLNLFSLSVPLGQKRYQGNIEKRLRTADLDSRQYVPNRGSMNP